MKSAADWAKEITNRFNFELTNYDLSLLAKIIRQAQAEAFEIAATLAEESARHWDVTEGELYAHSATDAAILIRARAKEVLKDE